MGSPSREIPSLALPLRWGRILLTTITARVLMQVTTALLCMNPLTTRIILTPEFGQSQQLINVWTTWEPLYLIAVV